MISRTATDPGIQFIRNIARSSACETAVALSASKVNPIRLILASGCRYCHGKWNDSSGIVSLRKAFDINRNPLCQVLPLFKLLRPSNCPLHGNLAQNTTTDKKDRIKFAVHRHLCDITISKGHGSGNRIKVYC